MQKGIDIIADVFFSILKDHPRTQLICIGPVIDLYGKFAALKLDHLMKRYPDRVCSKPQFTTLPPYLFSGAEFALIPSRDEPFGLVAVEFGRKGALGVGSKVGGLGQMPGWWYTVESMTPEHLIHQFKQAIRHALASDQDTRAKMRARALVQRFPLQQWVADLDRLQATSIRVSRQQRQQQQHSGRSRNSIFKLTPASSGCSTPTYPSRAPTSVSSIAELQIPESSVSSMAATPANRSVEALPQIESAQTTRSLGDGAESEPQQRRPAVLRKPPPPSLVLSAPSSPRSSQLNLGPLARGTRVVPSESSAPPTADDEMTIEAIEGSHADPARRAGHLFSYDAIVDNKSVFELQKVDANFTDSQNEFYNDFSRQLGSINVKSSEGRLCIDKFLTKSEKAWFGRFHLAKLGTDPETSWPTTLPGLLAWIQARWQRLRQDFKRDPDSDRDGQSSSPGRQSTVESIYDKNFSLGSQYEPPNGMKKLLQKKIGDWQLYCFLLAFVRLRSYPPSLASPSLFFSFD